MSAPQERLSEEVWDLIIGSIIDLPSLAVLARVSKHFNRRTLPHLYAHVSFLTGAGDCGVKHLRSFTLLMLQNPEVAALVRKFTLRDTYAWETNDDPDVNGPIWSPWPQHPELDIILKNAINAQLSLDTQAAIRRDEDEATEDGDTLFRLVRSSSSEAAVIALLLPKLVNLRSMEVPFQVDWDPQGEGFSVGTNLLLKVFERASRRERSEQSPPVFGCVTDVILPGYDDKYPDNPVFFGSCIGLPAIRRLFGFNQGDTEEDRPDEDMEPSSGFREIEPGSSSVDLIELRHSKLNVWNLLKLLRAPICLKTFIYEIGNTWAWTTVRFSAIQSALDFQKDHLERLCLSHAFFYPFMPDSTDELTPLNFSNFLTLKHLRVAPIFLYGGERLQLGNDTAIRVSSAPEVSQADLLDSEMILKDALPEKLETLSLVYCNDPSTADRLVLGLTQLLSCRETHFAHLREVSIHSIKPDTLHSKLEALTALPWKAKNVHFIVRLEEEWNYEPEKYRERGWGWEENVEGTAGHHNHGGPVEILYDSQG